MAGNQDACSSFQKLYFDRSFTFHDNSRFSDEPKKSQPPISDPKKSCPNKAEPSPTLWSQATKRLSDLGFSFRRSSSSRSIRPPPPSDQPRTNGRIVIYFTSLRGIRRTYEDCVSVRAIFRGLRVPVDERDLSMDFSYRWELQALLGKNPIVLPQVFIGGRHIGGAEEVRQLHEAGELRRLLEGFPVRRLGLTCESCADVRFVPCTNCNGSRKVFDKEEEQLRRCPECNENGLVRCPNCCC